jgi:hypothetical protein
MGHENHHTVEGGYYCATYDGRMMWVFLHDLLDAAKVEPSG